MRQLHNLSPLLPSGQSDWIGANHQPIGAWGGVALLRGPVGEGGSCSVREGPARGAQGRSRRREAHSRGSPLYNFPFLFFSFFGFSFNYFYFWWFCKVFVRILGVILRFFCLTEGSQLVFFHVFLPTPRVPPSSPADPISCTLIPIFKADLTIIHWFVTFGGIF